MTTYQWVTRDIKSFIDHSIWQAAATHVPRLHVLVTWYGLNSLRGGEESIEIGVRVGEWSLVAVLL